MEMLRYSENLRVSGFLSVGLKRALVRSSSWQYSMKLLGFVTKASSLLKGINETNKYYESML